MPPLMNARKNSPNPPQRMGLRRSAMLLVAITLLPALAFVFHAAYATYAATLASSRMTADLLAKQVAADQADFIDHMRETMAGIAVMANGSSTIVLGGDCSKMRALVTRYPVLASAAISDPQGRIVCLSNDNKGAINVSDRAYFQQVVARGRFVWDGPVQSRSTNILAMVAASPMLDAANDLLGVLIFAVRLDSLQERLKKKPLPVGGAVTLVDRDGKIVASHPPRDVAGETIPDRDPFFAFTRGEIATGPEGIGLDGVDRVWAYARLPRHGTEAEMFARVGVPRAESLNAAREVLLEGLASIGLLFATGLALAWVGAGVLIVRPLRKLHTAAQRMGEGNLTARTGVPHGKDEVGELAAKLDELAAHGQRMNRALRTLSAGNRTLLRERDERSLLAAMCRVAVEKGGYPVAYVCYPRTDDEKSIEVAAHCGNDGGYITSNRLTWADGPSGNGSVARCIRSGERVIVRSFANDQGLGPWRQAAAAQGFTGVISLPLRVQSALIGTLTLLVKDQGAFDDQEVDLLDEMAADLSFGIEVIRAEVRRKEAEEIARRALTHDTVIDLPNRAWFTRRVMDCIARGRTNHEPVAVLDIHLGRLQDIEDSFGHEHGNDLLRQVAARLKQLPGAEENLARLPMEDFGIVLCAYDAEEAQRMATAVREALDEPVRLGEAQIDVQASVGISMYPGHGDEAEVLVRRASIAARDAFRKDLTHSIYSGAMARENPGRLALAAELRTAIETRELVLHFQPKVGLHGGVEGCEALVRWQHPARGMIPPIEFIGLAEEIGLIRPLTYQIIDLAIRQLHAWRKAGINIPVAVNLSARNLYDPNLLSTLDGMFSTWDVPRSLLHFEITEAALVDDPAAAKKTLEALSAQGAKIYVDDFGTGYSSLSYLVSLPVHSLKIDRSFIRDMTKSGEVRSLVASIISMSHALKLRVVAEGVEREADAALLADLGCDEAQGYLFSKPLAEPEFRIWMANSAQTGG